jgi:diguanylate cyclase (GGDEF)-like protein
LNDELSRLARHDHLTGLFNRPMFQDTLELANSRVDRSGSLMGILYIDLDGFKPVNDRFGHDVGDTLLVEVVRRLKSGLRASDVMARLGGDEFGVIVENLKTRHDALKIAQNLIERLKEPFDVEGERVHISASIGAVVTARTVEDASALVTQADRAMYGAKSLGRGQAALAPAGATAKPCRNRRRS